jgi:hypothetical protein
MSKMGKDIRQGKKKQLLANTYMLNYDFVLDDPCIPVGQMNEFSGLEEASTGSIGCCVASQASWGSLGKYYCNSSCTLCSWY